MKLKPEVKEKWLAALRSGEYKQAKEALRDVVKASDEGVTAHFCCLGVLCDLYVKEVADPAIAKWVDYDLMTNDPPEPFEALDMRLTEGVLAPAVVKWAFAEGGEANPTIPAEAGVPYPLLEKLKYNGGFKYETGNEAVELTVLNDNGMKFPAIANLIEKEL